MKNWHWTDIVEYVMAALIGGGGMLLLIALENGWFK